jgi:hypothetical protein
MAAEDDEIDVPKLVAVAVEYCSVCSLPCEYCEFGSSVAQCKEAAAAGSIGGAHLFFCSMPFFAAFDLIMILCIQIFRKKCRN